MSSDNTVIIDSHRHYTINRYSYRYYSINRPNNNTIFTIILGTKDKKLCCSAIINNINIEPWRGVGDALLFHSNNHMDPDDSENPVQSLPHCQNVSVFNDDWENIVGKVLYLVVLDVEVHVLHLYLKLSHIRTFYRSPDVAAYIPIHHQRWK